MSAPDKNDTKTIALSEIKPHSLKRPKGFAPYNPRENTKPTMARVLKLYKRIEQADALPLGPRQVGYRLKELHPGQYDKDAKIKARPPRRPL